MICCLPGHHWLLPQRNRRHGKHLLRPTQSTLIGVSSGWVGLRLLACLQPHPCLFPHPFLLPPFLLPPFLQVPFPLHPFLLPALPLHPFMQLTHRQSESNLCSGVPPD